METLIHNLDFVFSLVALVIAVIALVIALRKPGPSGYGAPGAPVAPTPGAQLFVNLVKMPSDTAHGVVAQDFRFWITNIGTGPAMNVDFEVEQGEELLFQQECLKKLPTPTLHPGERIELCSRIGVNTPKVLQTVVYWEDGTGQPYSQESSVSKDLV